MTTTITASVADLLKACDVLFAGFKADHGFASSKKMGLPATCWPVPGGVQLGAQLSGGVLSVLIPATLDGDPLDEFTFGLAAIRDQKAALGKGDVRMVLSGNTFLVEAAGAAVLPNTMQGLARQPVADFLSPDPDRVAEFTVGTAALPWVGAAMVGDDSRPVLAMVHYEAARPGSDRVTLLAADGFRLHEADARATVARWDGWDTVHPADSYVSLPGWLTASLMKLGCETVAVRAGWWKDGRRECLVGAHGALSLRAALVPSGAAPDFRKITSGVPDDASPCVGKMAELVAALTALKPVAKWSANIFRVTPEDGALVLESTAVEVGTVRRRVATTGPGLVFGASVGLWLDALGKPKNGAGFAITFDPRMVKEDGFSSPIRLTTEQPFGEARAIIMPMHIAR